MLHRDYIMLLPWEPIYMKRCFNFTSLKLVLKLPLTSYVILTRRRKVSANFNKHLFAAHINITQFVLCQFYAVVGEFNCGPHNVRVKPIPTPWFHHKNVLINYLKVLVAHITQFFFVNLCNHFLLEFFFLSIFNALTKTTNTIH